MQPRTDWRETMYLDIHALRAFYQRQLGGIVRRLLGARIRARWRNVKGCTVVGLGFAVPYLGAFRGEAERVGAFMLATQGAMVWPAQGPSQGVMVDEATLPLPDASVDRLLCVHCLEVSEHARALIREMWRVLSPEGRLLLVVPNRRGVWARFDTTPFGHGRPYSRGQLETMLTEALFTPLDLSNALYMPPMHRPWLLRWATAFERMGARAWPAFAGVIVVEARKELMGVLPKGKLQRARRTLITLPSPLRREREPEAVCERGPSADPNDVRTAPRAGTRAAAGE